MHLSWFGAKTFFVLPQIKGYVQAYSCHLASLPGSEVTAGHSSCSGLADALLIWLHQWNAKIRPQRLQQSQWEVYLFILYSTPLYCTTTNTFISSTVIQFSYIGYYISLFSVRQRICCTAIQWDPLCYLLMWWLSSSLGLPPTPNMSFHTFLLTYFHGNFTVLLSPSFSLPASFSHPSFALIGSASHLLTWPWLFKMEQAVPLLIPQNDRIAYTILWYDCMHANIHTHMCDLHAPAPLEKMSLREELACFYSNKSTCHTSFSCLNPLLKSKVQSSEELRMQACKCLCIQVCLFPCIVALPCN